MSIGSRAFKILNKQFRAVLVKQHGRGLFAARASGGPGHGLGLEPLEPRVLLSAAEGWHSWQNDAVDATPAVATVVAVDPADRLVVPLTPPDWHMSVVAPASFTGFVAGSEPGDYTGDGRLDAADINVLVAAIRDGLTDPSFDLNGDAAVDVLDYQTMIFERVDTAMGDVNLDRVVSYADFAILQNHFNQPGGWGEGDANGDGLVGFADFVPLQNNFNQDFRRLTATLANDTAPDGLTNEDGLTSDPTVTGRVNFVD